MPSPERPRSVGRGTRPSVANRLLHDRSLRLGSTLAVAVAIPVAILFYFEVRSLHDLENTSTVVLRQLSEETADSLTEDIEQVLKAPHIGVLLRIGQSVTEPLNLPAIEPIFADNLEKSPFIDSFYVWSAIAETHAGDVVALRRMQAGGQPGRALGAEEQSISDYPDSELRQHIPEADGLLRQVRELSRHRRAIVAFQMTIDGRPSHVQAQLRFNNAARDRLTSFVAFSAANVRLRDEFLPALLREKMRTLQGPTGFPSLVVTLLDEDGRTVFHSDAMPPSTYVDERQFPLVFFDKELLAYMAPLETRPRTWRLRTGYGRQTIPEVVGASTGPQLGLMIALAGVMAVGVFFVSRAAAREVRLAELKSNFVSSVSHDLKTPLALIQLFAETLELGRVKTAERAQEYYRIINSEAQKLTRLINNILDFSRIEAGLRQYQMAPVDLSDLTSRVLASLESQFNQNHFTVRRELPAEMPHVPVDGPAVAQALENVLSNAMKYSPDHREIAVTVRSEPGFGCIHVSDRGIGIPKPLHRRIFRKFYRVENNGFGPQGSGLGLAIVDHIMRAHRGFVRVESAPGRGSMFTLCFPTAGEGNVDEADSGDRGRASDVARAS